MPSLGLDLLAIGAGGTLGSMLAPNTKSSSEILLDNINDVLNRSLKDALSESKAYTGQATGRSEQSLQAAIDALTGYNQKAIDAAQGAAMGGLQTGQALRSPYRTAGYDALDRYRQTLGLSTPQGGSAASVQAQQQAQVLAPLLKQLEGNYTLGAAPEGPQLQSTDITTDQINERAMQMLRDHNAIANGRDGLQYSNRTDMNNIFGVKLDPRSRWWQTTDAWINNPNVQNVVKNQLLAPINQANQQAQQQYEQAQQAYQGRQQQFGQLSSLLGQMTPEQQQQAAVNLRGLL